MNRPTQGPWAWLGSPTHGLYLATVHSGRRFVMQFSRMGMRYAQPVFQVNKRMIDAKELCKFEVGDERITGYEQAKKDSSVYRYDITGIDHPDARLIAAAPELLELVEDIARIGIDFGYGDFALSQSHVDKARALIAKITPMR